MSTNAMIGIVNKDHTVTAVYCHFDGYPDYAGAMLMKYYSDPEKARKLIGLGNISRLMQKLEPEKGQKHTFYEPADGVTVAYHRDRNDAWIYAQPEKYRSIDSYRQLLITVYKYLFDTNSNKWLYSEDGKDFKEIREINDEYDEQMFSTRDMMMAYYKNSSDKQVLDFVSKVTGLSPDTLLEIEVPNE